jgi:serine/threonine protein kinase
VRWLQQAATALDAGHAVGVVHRDVKPGNLLLDGHGDVHVADFGVASAVGLDSMTMTGMVLGTSGYLSPEQARGERATPASDRYALAVVAWELLMGKRPFESESPTAEAAAHVNAPVPSISQEGDVPRELDPVFQRGLAKDPGARYGSAADFVAALRSGLEQPETATVPLPPAPTPPRRRVGWLIPLLAALALMGGGLALATVLRGGGEPQTRTTTKEGQTTTVTTERKSTTTGTTATTAAATVSAEEAERLNNEAFGLMNEGRYAEALPMLEQAIGALRGTGTLAEAYTSYNLAATRLELGRCDDVIALLERSQSLQRPRREIARVRRQAAKQCA